MPWCGEEETKYMPGNGKMETNYYAHETACIDAGARVGKDTKIWHFCHVMGDAEIGERCILGQNVYIDRAVKIGNGVKIQNNVSVYKGVEVEDDAFLGPSVVFTNVLNPRSFIERKEEFRKTYIRTGATIGANATVVCGVEIGAYALIGAGTVVTRDVPPFALVVGNPGIQKGWVSRNGHRIVFDETGFFREGEWIYKQEEEKLLVNRLF
jgi:UDP-2-acetamido-3-amino-2,3-dideoxy-glucuronate N-acetyltransferase